MSSVPPRRYQIFENTEKDIDSRSQSVHREPRSSGRIKGNRNQRLETSESNHILRKESFGQNVPQVPSPIQINSSPMNHGDYPINRPFFGNSTSKSNIQKAHTIINIYAQRPEPNTKHLPPSQERLPQYARPSRAPEGYQPLVGRIERASVTSASGRDADERARINRTFYRESSTEVRRPDSVTGRSRSKQGTSINVTPLPSQYQTNTNDGWNPLAAIFNNGGVLHQINHRDNQQFIGYPNPTGSPPKQSPLGLSTHDYIKEYEKIRSENPQEQPSFETSRDLVSFSILMF